MSTFFAEHCFFLTGPTACGKTALALEFALRENAEILSMDSVAVYRDMNIGSAKPTPEEQALVPHHLLDVVTPDREFSVVEYMRAAETAARDCLVRGKKPLFVGGTPLYMKALIFGLFDGPEGDETFREKMRALSQEALQNGDAAFLHRKLQAADPITAARLHPNDTKRIIRALEVFELTGRPIHSFQTQFQPELPPGLKDRIRIIDIPRPDLHLRIEARVDKMFETGFFHEVEELRAKYKTLSKTAALAVGYREILAFLDAQKVRSTPNCNDFSEKTGGKIGGKTDGNFGEDFDGKIEKRDYSPREMEALASEIKTHTRQMAKRQVTWFRSLMHQEFMF